MQYSKKTTGSVHRMEFEFWLYHITLVEARKLSVVSMHEIVVTSLISKDCGD